jgi:hypothetical protein
MLQSVSDEQTKQRYKLNYLINQIIDQEKITSVRVNDGSRVRGFEIVWRSGNTQRKGKKKESKNSGPRSGSIHILVLAQVRNVGYHGARIYRYLFPHAVIHGSYGGSQSKHARVLLAEERERDRHPELDVPLVFAHLRV